MENSDDETSSETPQAQNSIDLVKYKSHITQIYCIPCTANVKNFSFDKVIEA